MFSKRMLPAYQTGRIHTRNVQVVPTNLSDENGTFGLNTEPGVRNVAAGDKVNGVATA